MEDRALTPKGGPTEEDPNCMFYGSAVTVVIVVMVLLGIDKSVFGLWTQRHDHCLGIKRAIYE
jgi:hypothetical protein